MKLRSNILFLNRVKIGGNWEFDETFKNGITGIYGDNQKGKTTLINLIFKGLGISDKTDDICNQNVKEIYIEFKLNEKKFTVKNDFSKSRRRAYLNDGWVIDHFNEDKSTKIQVIEIKNLIEREFNLNEYMRRDHTNQILNNIGQCYRAFYLIQGTIREIIARFPDIRRTVVKSLLREPRQPNIFKDKRIELKEKRSKLEKKIALERLNLKTNFVKVKDILSSSKVLDTTIPFKIDFLTEIINKNVNEQLNDILNKKIEQKKKANINFDNKINPLNIEENPELIKIDKKNFKLNQNKQQISKEIGALTERKHKFNEDIDKIEERIIEINRKIEEKDFSITIIPFGLRVNVCPRCDRRITNKMYQREKEGSKRCALCDRELIVKPEIAKDELLSSKGTKQKEKDDLLIGFNEIKEQIKNKENKLIELDNQISSYNENKKTKKKQLIESFQEELKSLFKGYDELKDEIHKIQTDIRIYNSYEKSFENYNNFTQKFKQVNNELRKIESEKVFEEEVEKFWLDSLQFFMEQILGDKFEIESFRDSDAKIRFKKKDKLADHERNMMNVGYYYAFLKTSLKFSIKFPRIIFLDCFATEELIAPKVIHIIELFKKLFDENKEKEFQIFLATASPEILKYEREFNVLKPKSGDFLITHLE